MLSRRTCFIALVLWLSALTAHAMTPMEVLSIASNVRQHGCKGHAAVDRPFILNSKLNSAAGNLQRGEKLHDATEHADYRADQSAAIHISGTIDHSLLTRAFGERYCETLTDKALVDIGIHSVNKDVWIVLAAPFKVPAPSDARAVSQQVLRLVNVARSQSQRCGKQKFAAVASLTLDETLSRTALAHSRDMAQRDGASHTGSDSSSPGDRATRAGYRWKFIGENVASGQMTAAEVVQGWLDSPHHCANIMDKQFTQMGVAYAVNEKSSGGIFWTQLFGKPQ